LSAPAPDKNIWEGWDRGIEEAIGRAPKARECQGAKGVTVWDVREVFPSHWGEVWKKALPLPKI